jgi:hypothetical protein
MRRQLIGMNLPENLIVMFFLKNLGNQSALEDLEKMQAA